MTSRRSFVRAAAVTAAGVGLGGTTAVAQQGRRSFKLRYAPHFGMFKEHAGDDLVAQLEFMRAEGFTALEDNDMKRRSVADQERIAATMQRLGMRMGVFVAHEIAWNEANLTSGDAAKRDAFVQQVRDSRSEERR